jgi:predicted transcriptional regulator
MKNHTYKQLFFVFFFKCRIGNTALLYQNGNFDIKTPCFHNFSRLPLNTVRNTFGVFMSESIDENVVGSVKQNRTQQLTIRLEPKIYEALLEVADRVGIKPSSIAGLAIGEYVTKAQAVYNSNTVMQRIMAEEMVNHIKPFLTDDMLKMFVEAGMESVDDD